MSVMKYHKLSYFHKDLEKEIIWLALKLAHSYLENQTRVGGKDLPGLGLQLVGDDHQPENYKSCF